MKSSPRLLLGLLGIGLLTACETPSMVVLQPMEYSMRTAKRQVMVVRGEDSVYVPEEVREAFEKELEMKLYEGDELCHGFEVQLQYRFMRMADGMAVEVTYTDGAGVEIGRFHTLGKINSGFFGGSCEKTAGEIANYTRKVVFSPCEP